MDEESGSSATLHAHRMVLHGASEYFQKAIEWSARGGETSEKCHLRIDSVSPDVGEAIIGFLYGNELKARPLAAPAQRTCQHRVLHTPPDALPAFQENAHSVRTKAVTVGAPFNLTAAQVSAEQLLPLLVTVDRLQLSEVLEVAQACPRPRAAALTTP